MNTNTYSTALPATSAGYPTFPPAAPSLPAGRSATAEHQPTTYGRESVKHGDMATLLADLIGRRA